ncbi:MAG: CRISPR-associated helicase Cas3' [Ardenticatenaceae bacterium]|nr:CRISPR-associated helicase Cas3' [Ardenticatenaceae bacterium]
MSERTVGKAERLLQIEHLLLAYPEGLPQAEIARRTGVNRSTIHRSLPELTARFAVYETDDGRLAIDRDRYLTHVRLTIHEAMAVHLATRLLAAWSDKHNPHAGAALRKLGQALERLAPRVARHLVASADVMDGAAQRQDAAYLHVLETLTRAWSDGQMTHVWHRMDDGRVFDYDFAPYFVEPYPWGHTSHAIGLRRPPGEIRTFKLERIQRIKLLPERYEIPATFDPRTYLASAWGIWTSEKPQEVILRFHPRVRVRVLETRWHPDGQPEEREDGSVTWRAPIAEPREMLPWIRGWGADVEVLAPAWLRDELVEESRRLAQIYKILEAKPIPGYRLLWAKTDRQQSGATHPLLCHLIDVGQVVLALWNLVLTESFRAQIAAALGLDVESAGRLLALWAALHDLGKACPGFQMKYKSAETYLSAAGLPFPKVFVHEPCYHATVSARVLDALLTDLIELPLPKAKKIARAIGGHHGAWPVPKEVQDVNQAQVGGLEWDQARRDLVNQMAMIFRPPPVKQLGQPTTEENMLLVLLSGLTSVADWIGSMEEFFPFASVHVDPVQYAERAAAQASRALQALGWTGWQPPTLPMPFEIQFDVPEPRPAQAQVMELATRLNQPALVIIEAMTGIGKTEAGLYLADHWARTCQQRGVYVAMPTQATSNQMFGRVRRALARRYSESLVNLQLIHSQAGLSANLRQIQLHRVNEDSAGTVAAMSWFFPRKRSLLATFGVGTVDQALMSVLQTHHFFVRLFALSRKTVIFDEVHAYDSYMSILFERLLAWLRAVGTSVVILSATLPADTRRRLVRAYLGQKAAEVPDASYPAVTWAMDGQVGVAPLTAPPSRTLALEWMDGSVEAIVERLTAELREGGCAAVLCNRVARAQEVYRGLAAAQIVAPEDLILFHARFPAGRRDEIERQVLECFGKDGNRPERAIVVATQVIEQSLDLDFDLMLSDLAPVDLLLQRAGRLHRHERKCRPTRLAAPRLLVVTPAEKNGVATFGRDEYVYERYVLLRSYLALQRRNSITLPTETTSLIEAVYGDGILSGGSGDREMEGALAEALATMRKAREEAEFKARSRVVPWPHSDELLNQRNQALAEDDPEVHQVLQALTRLIPPTISLVCLHQTAAGLALEPDGPVIVDVAQPPNDALTEQLARCVVTVGRADVVRYFLSQSVPVGWKEHPMLRNHRLAVFTTGVCRLAEGYPTLRLSRALGLEIRREER